MKKYNESLNKVLKLEDMINELKVLEESNTLYDVSLEHFPGALNMGNLSFVDDAAYAGGRILIELSDLRDLGLSAHELKHAYQFETGRLSPGSPLLYDLTDEEEAYERGSLFGGPSFSSQKGKYRKLESNEQSINSTMPIKHLEKLSKKGIFKYNNKVYKP